MSAKMGAPVSFSDACNIVAQTRKALGLSQEELAGKIGLTRGAISQFENGTRAISKPVALLCRILLAHPEIWNELQD